MAKVKVKKIYRYVDRLVRKCMWCKGSGASDIFIGDPCMICKGSDGTYQRVKIPVGEEVIK